MGGYTITYRGQVSGSSDIIVDITCGQDTVIAGLVTPLYTESNYEDTANNKNISITGHVSSAALANLTVRVEDLVVQDAGPDADVDAGVDAGVLDPQCDGVFEDAAVGIIVDIGIPVAVGGYVFTYRGQQDSEEVGGVLIDVDCESNGSVVADNQYCELYTEVTIPDRPINIVAHVRSATRANISYSVE